MRIFRADIDIAHGRADRDAGDRHALDQEERIALHQHAVGESAAVALIRIADDVFAIRCRRGGGSPFDARREAGAAAPAQARGQNLVDRRLGPEPQRGLQPLQPAVAAVIVERERVGQAAAREHEPLLPLEIGNILDPSERLRVGAPDQEPAFEQRAGVRIRDRTVTHPAGRGLDFDERLQPEKAARTGAHDREVDAPIARLSRKRSGDGVGADGEGGGIAGDEDLRVHDAFPSASATIASIFCRSRRPIGWPSRSAAGESAQLPRQ